MVKLQRQRGKPPHVLPQLTLPLPGRVQLDAKQRAQLIALLSRLLLEAARAKREVGDDAS